MDRVRGANVELRLAAVEILASPGLTVCLCIGSASLARDVTQSFASPPFSQGSDAIACLLRIDRVGKMLGCVGDEHIRNQRVFSGTAPWPMFLPEMFDKPFLSAATVVFRAACADEARSVSDNPLSPPWIEVEARRRPSSWHFRTMFRSDWSVV